VEDRVIARLFGTSRCAADTPRTPTSSVFLGDSRRTCPTRDKKPSRR
jgi:hypothetical protein